MHTNTPSGRVELHPTSPGGGMEAVSSELYPTFTSHHVTVFRLWFPLWEKYAALHFSAMITMISKVISGSYIRNFKSYVYIYAHLSGFCRYIQSLMEILEFLDKNPDDHKVLGE